MTDKKSCFVISPIGEPGSPERYKADNVLNYIIIPAAVGYEVVRAEKIADPGLISRQIIEKIQNDGLVIADLTDGNPNVFYELAVRHAVGKPTVQIIQQGQRPPFDVLDMRTISFDPADLKSVDECKNSIKAAIEATEREDYKVISPLTGPLNLDQLQEGNVTGGIVQLLEGMLDLLRSQGLQLDGITRQQLTVGRIDVRPNPDFLSLLGSSSSFGAPSITAPNWWTCICGSGFNVDQSCSKCGVAKPTTLNP